MTDEFARDLLPAAFEFSGASIPLNILRTSDDFGRTLSESAYPHREGARLRDMGGRPRRTRCTLVFLPPDVIAQVNVLIDVSKEGAAGLLIHPLFGSYKAFIEELNVEGSAAERDYLVAHASFVEDIETAENVRDLFDSVTGRNEVDGALDLVDAELATAGLESELSADVSAQLDAWDLSGLLDQRRLSLELAALSARVQEEADRFDLVTDVANYPVVTALAGLHNNLRNYASRLMATAPRLTSHTVVVRRPLLAILQDLHGGQGALDRFERALDMNDIPSPAAVDAGTVLTVEAP